MGTTVGGDDDIATVGAGIEDIETLLPYRFFRTWRKGGTAEPALPGRLSEP